MNVRSALLTLLLGTPVLFAAPSARAMGCRTFLSGWLRRTPPVPEIARGFAVGPLVNARWIKSGAQYLTSFGSAWGQTRVRFDDAYLTISVRGIAGDLRFHEGTLRALRERVGPVDHTDGMAIDPGQRGELKPSPGWYSIYLGHAQTGSAEYPAKAHQLLDVFFGALPYELRQVPKTRQLPLDIIPLSMRDDRWRLVGRSWWQTLKTPWGRTTIAISEDSLRVKIDPEAGDLIFGPRDLDALKAKIPTVHYSLQSSYNAYLEIPVDNSDGHFQLIFDQDEEYDVAQVEVLLNAVLTSQPKKARAEILTGKRPARMFDRLDRGSTHPIED